MPSPFKPSVVAQSLNAPGARSLSIRQAASPNVTDPGARTDGRNPLWLTGAEALTAQADFLLKRRLNATDAKYFVAPGGDIYYLNGEERKLNPLPPPPPVVPSQYGLTLATDLRDRRTRLSPPTEPYPPENVSLGHSPRVGRMDEMRRR